jgi:ORF6N domain
MRKSIAAGEIARAILILRGQRVLQDSELAALYGVSTKRFNQQVRRNRKPARHPRCHPPAHAPACPEAPAYRLHC